METAPGLTVVIPTRNRPALLRQAITSVLASPLMTATPGRVIVVDDGPSQESRDVASSLGVSYVCTAGGGPSVARNAGLSFAQTELVAFLDDDDCWLPRNMEPQLAALKAHPAAAFAFGSVQLTSPDLVAFGGPFPGMPAKDADLHLFVYASQLQVGAIAFRRDLLKSEGGFDPSLRLSEDSDLLTRLAARHPVVPVDIVGSLFRQRQPSRRDAEARWAAHCAWVESNRKLRRLGALPSFRKRALASFQIRGREVFYFCRDAGMALRESRRRDAWRYLGFALRISPAHALGSRTFWLTLNGLVRLAIRPASSAASGVPPAA